MATDNYRAAQKSMRAIREGGRLAALEEGSARLMTMAEAERDRIRSERALEKQQRRLGLANAVGTVAGIVSGAVLGPAAGAAVGGGTTLAGRRLAQGGWKNRVDGLTFAASRESLRKEMRPDVVTDLGVSANAAATGYRAGKFFDSLATTQASAAGAIGEDQAKYMTAQDVSRNGLKVRIDRQAIYDRYRNMTKDLRTPMSFDDFWSSPFGDNSGDPVIETKLRISDIIRGRL